MISKKSVLASLWFACLSFSSQAAEKIKVVTTLPDLAWMVQEIGGDLVEGKPLLRGTESPHFVDAIPDFVRQVADADVVCMIGLDLEVGYMPPILAKSGNAKVQPGGAGYCDVGKAVHALEKPTGPIDRSMGDVHPSGNPHYYLSPKAMADGGREVVRVLSRVDPSHASDYEKGLLKFKSMMDNLGKDIRSRLAPLLALQKDKPILIEFHKEFAYYLEEFGILSFGSIEEKPGVPPSAGRLGEVSSAAKAAGVRVALIADYHPAKTIERFHELSGIPSVTVPTLVQPKGRFSNYLELQKHIADSLVKTIGANR